MKTTKVLSFALAATMSASMAGAAFAADPTTASQQKMMQSESMSMQTPAEKTTWKERRAARKQERAMAKQQKMMQKEQEKESQSGSMMK